MNGAECLLRTLVANGLEVCFMNPGTSEMQFVAALDRVRGMHGILCLFEGVCSGAADGYARMTGRPAATLLHLGPGLANALANFHNARKANSPVVSIVGEHSTQHLRHDAPLSSDIEAFARTVSVSVRTPADAAGVGLATADTIEAAVRPPGGVATLIVPADYSWGEAGGPGPVASRQSRPMPDETWLRAAAEALCSGEPCGILLSGTALMGAGLDAASRLSAAGYAVFATRYAARTESGRGRFQPRRIPYFPEPALEALSGLRYLILVEAKEPVSFFGYPKTPSPLAPPDCAILPLAAVGEDGASALAWLSGEIGAPSLQRVDSSFIEMPANGPLNADAIGRTIAALMPEDAIVSDEMVSSGEAVWKHLLDAAPHDYLPVTGGSIGQGLPVAVGAAVACPSRKIVALEADGSGMYTLQALWTAARESLDVTVVVFANRRYRILEVEMRRTGATGFGPTADGMIDIGRPNLDWASLAKGMGVDSSRASTVEEFAGQFGAAMRDRGPRLIEALII